MIKKLWCFILTFCLSVSFLCTTTFAVDYNDITYRILAQKYDELNKAKFNTYDYKFIYKDFDGYSSPCGGKLNFDDGVLGGIIDDFDNDNQYELLVFVGKSNIKVPTDYGEDVTNSIEAQIYEVVDNEAKLSNISIVSYDAFYGESGGSECFIKTVNNNKYIVMQTTTEVGTFADGAHYSIKVIQYDGNRLNELFEIDDSASAAVILESEANNFKRYGFNNTYNLFDISYVDNEKWYRFSPYFDSFNLANIENNVEKIIEIIITNNADEYRHYDGNYDYNEEIKNIIDKAVISAKVNNFTNIQVIPNIKVILNGNEISFDQPPYIENGATRVPMRKIFESLGATVEYDANTKTITARKGSTIIELATGASTAKINGREMTLTSSVENKNGSTMVPLRFVSEALGAEVVWDGENKVITINLEEKENNGAVNVRALNIAYPYYETEEKVKEDFSHNIDIISKVIKNYTNYTSTSVVSEVKNVSPSQSERLYSYDKLAYLLENTFGSADDNDVSFVYYGGHSLYDNTTEPIIHGIMTKDNQLASFEEFYSLLEDKIQHGTVFVILDCCYAGDILKADINSRFHIITATDINQTGKYVSECEVSGLIKKIITAVFYNSSKSMLVTEAINDGLSGISYKKADENKDKSITVDELYNYIIKYLADEGNDGSLTPKVFPENDNTVIFTY